MNKDFTLKEISASSGVSISSVSRFLTDPDSVKDSTKRKINTAMRAYHNTANKKGTNTIALIVPDITNQFFPLISKGIESIAAANKMTILICDSQGSLSVEEKIISRLLEIGIDGIICICTGNGVANYKELVEEKTIPIIFLDRFPEINNVSTITSDNFGGMYQSTKYLLSLGHEKILYLNGPDKVSTAEQRKKGFLAAMEENNLFPSDDDIVTANYDYSLSYMAVKNILSRNKFSYTAICAANDLMAIGAYMAITESGLKVPEEVSIIGYDNIQAAEMIKMTTIRQPYEEMGRIAMLELINQKESIITPRKNLILPTNIIIRNTCMINPKIIR